MPIRIQQRERWFQLLVLACAAAASRSAHASSLMLAPDCGVSGGGYSCYLPGILRFLYALAIVLGVVLLVVVALAIKIYRKNKVDKKVGS
ncbi:MAG: hypothetical protein WB439_07540 [Acidobacteriaceae bacterium]